MKKILLVILVFFSCGCMRKGASEAVVDYLNKFKNHDYEVMKILDEILTDDDLSETEKNLYKTAMKRQYTDLEYKILLEQYNADLATVLVSLTVYDFLFAEDLSFYDKLKNMENCEKRIFYTVSFDCQYDEGKWKVLGPSYEVLEKIHGIYDYKSD